ncbi:MAG: TrkA family potassium uptake protein [Ignavibacteriaceae bacterium]
MKQFVVIGLGNFGFNVAKSLSSRGHQVLAIDIDKEKIDEIKDYVSEAIIADAKNAKVLNEFIHGTVDGVIVSIGQNMESSILTTHYLKERKIKQIIVKALNENHAKILSLMGADDMILPEKDMAISLAQRLSSNNMLEYLPLTSEFSIVEAAVPEKFFGKSMREIKLRTKYNLLVIAVKDIMQDKFYLMPNADYKLVPDSLMIIMGKRNDIEKFNI